MPTITISGFRGASLETDDTLLPDGVGVVSLNQRPGFDDFRPWAGLGSSVASVPTSPQRLTLYRLGQDSTDVSSYWLGWSSVVHAVRGFEGEDPSERTYYTGDGAPKWTNNIIGLGGGPPYPQAARDLAVPAPTSALTAAINTNPGSGTDQAFQWAYTFVNELGWESAPSPASNSLLAKPGCTFDLTGFEAAPAGNHGINRIRIYQLQSGISAASFFFLREFAIGSTPAQPIADARALGSDVLATSGWRPLPSNAHSLTKLWNGMFAAASDKFVKVCEPYKHYAWPLRYDIDLPSAVVGMAVWGQRLLVLTTADAHIIAGSSPEGLDEEPASINQPCASRRGIVAFNESESAKGVIWPSFDGLCWYGDGGYRNLTDGLMSAAEWRAMAPQTMVAVEHDGLYLCFYNDGSLKGFVIDPRRPTGIYMLATGYAAVTRDAATGRVFVLDAGQIREWDAGAALMTATFRSKLIKLPEPMNVGALEVVAKGFPVTVKVWAGATLVIDRTLTGQQPVRGTPGWTSDEIRVEVSAAARVIAVRLAEGIDGLRAV